MRLLIIPLIIVLCAIVLGWIIGRPIKLALTGRWDELSDPENGKGNVDENRDLI